MSKLALSNSFEYLWVDGHYKLFHSFSAGIIFRRQNQTSTDDPRSKRIEKFLMAVDP